jgi:hypothetical protein
MMSKFRITAELVVEVDAADEDAAHSAFLTMLTNLSDEYCEVRSVEEVTDDKGDEAATLSEDGNDK